MGVEYFIVKPDKKEIFYLGKHIEPLDCMNVFSADYLKVDNFNEFLLDVIETNDGFLGEEYTYKDIKEFAYILYEWCDAPVYLSSDASSEYDTFKDYEETGSIITYCEKHEPLVYRIISLLDNDCSVVEVKELIDNYYKDFC